jgi:hypothetical protein
MRDGQCVSARSNEEKSINPVLVGSRRLEKALIGLFDLDIRIRYDSVALIGYDTRQSSSGRCLGDQVGSTDDYP